VACPARQIAKHTHTHRERRFVQSDVEVVHLLNSNGHTTPHVLQSDVCILSLREKERQKEKKEEQERESVMFVVVAHQ
jgi:hypothetical protein